MHNPMNNASMSGIARISRFGSGGPYEDAVGYSRVVRVGDWFVTAGCTSVIDGELVYEGDAYQQAVTAFGVAIDALARAGCHRRDVIQSRMYLIDRNDADAVGRAHRELLGDARPAATLIVVAGLIDPRMLIEVELTACAASTHRPEP